MILSSPKSRYILANTQNIKKWVENDWGGLILLTFSKQLMKTIGITIYFRFFNIQYDEYNEIEIQHERIQWLEIQGLEKQWLEIQWKWNTM